MISFRLKLKSESETHSLGRALAQCLAPGDLLLLDGDLGAGKTTLTQGLAEGLGVPGVIASPTFTIANVYELPERDTIERLHHLDLYRLDPSEMESFGFEHYLDDETAVTVIEWPERAADRLPDRWILIRFAIAGPGVRDVDISASPPMGHDFLLSLRPPE